MVVSLHKVLPLSRTEFRAWQRWHRHLRIGQLLTFKTHSRARFPVINGGARG